jgi:hypothetical protein
MKNFIAFVTTQIVLNDKIPNPQGTTQGKTVRMVTIFTSITYPLHFRPTLLRLKGVSIIGLLRPRNEEHCEVHSIFIKIDFWGF